MNWVRYTVYIINIQEYMLNFLVTMEFLLSNYEDIKALIMGGYVIIALITREFILRSHD